MAAVWFLTMSPLLVGPLGRRIVEGSIGTSNDCLSWKKTYRICSIIKQHAGGTIIEDVVLSVFVARQKVYGQRTLGQCLLWISPNSHFPISWAKASFLLQECVHAYIRPKAAVWLLLGHFKLQIQVNFKRLVVKKKKIRRSLLEARSSLCPCLYLICKINAPFDIVNSNESEISTFSFSFLLMLMIFQE